MIGWIEWSWKWSCRFVRFPFRYSFGLNSGSIWRGTTGVGCWNVRDGTAQRTYIQGLLVECLRAIREV